MCNKHYHKCQLCKDYDDMTKSRGIYDMNYVNLFKGIVAL